MKNCQGKYKKTSINVLEKLIKTTVQSSLAIAMMAAPSTAISIKPLSTYSTGIFDDSAARITAYDPTSQNLFIANDSSLKLDVLNISDPSNPIPSFDSIDLSLYGNFGGVNSVAYSNGFFAVAVESETVTDPGQVLFFDAFGDFKNQLTVGALPDMLTFTPDGSKLLVANEAEPSDDYTIDPEGSVSIIDVSGGVDSLTDADVKFAGFQAFNDKIDELRAEGVRIFGPGSSVSQDLEPEAIALSEDGTTAYVTLQENNAIGILNLLTGEFTDVVALGFKDYSLPGNALDASNRDDEINIRNYPLKGMFLPDEIAAYTVGGKTYLVTANEGDARDYDGFSEEVRVKDLDLDPTLEELQGEELLGRLRVTNTMGDTDGDGDFDELYAFGARSFSIWDENGNLMFDSGDAFEQIIAGSPLFRDFFNSNNDENNFDNRSDDKGPEPEGLTIGMVGDKTLAFIGLERIGGFMTYDISNPLAPKFISYTNNRDFSVEFDVDEEGDPAPTAEQLAAVGDLGPEGLRFISSADSPTAKPLLVVANEVSGTTTIYDIDPTSVPEPGTIFGLLAFGAAGKFLLKRKSKTTQE
ncbi:MAG: choice-of-anchor I family protein [Microcoleaceae cyanobacterium MO_207.B10]|nr:choice-of-anchor I family protein [Microcoleaceae cyanobacterium MO_207.B10]